MGLSCIGECIGEYGSVVGDVVGRHERIEVDGVANLVELRISAHAGQTVAFNGTDESPTMMSRIRSMSRCNGITVRGKRYLQISMPSSSESNNSHDRSMIWRSGIMFNCFDRITAIFRVTTGSPHARALLMTSAFFLIAMENELSDIPIDEILERHSLCSLHAIYLRYQCTCGSSPRLRGTQAHRFHRPVRAGIIPALAGNTFKWFVTYRPTWDHPRACGEHVACTRSVSNAGGSSPRLRGTRDRATGRHSHRRIIPALAGNTPAVRYDATESRDHPRACGEHGWPAHHIKPRLGSSPRLRGTLLGHGEACEGRGIIPALAGNTVAWSRADRSSGDHPRACGEHLNNLKLPNAPKGSSPRLRGTRHQRRLQRWQGGIIPALAGNTTTVTASRPIRWDHPRACGEPHREGRIYQGARGIIPALAGNTARIDRPSSAAWDHPRACGEHQGLRDSGAAQAGSSPRLRGTRTVLVVRGDGRGIIPALAGNTPSSPDTIQTRWDHPRACGEHCRSRRRSARTSGSSPRLRGTPQLWVRVRGAMGIIPALAGNTGCPRCWGRRSGGSAPRLRGTPSCSPPVLREAGIIPALAGNTYRFFRCFRSYWDHPRACGEHIIVPWVEK